MSTLLSYFGFGVGGVGKTENRMAFASSDAAYDTLLDCFPSTLLTNVVCVVGPNETRVRTNTTPIIDHRYLSSPLSSSSTENEANLKGEKGNSSCPNAQEEEEKQTHQRLIVNWRTSFISEALRVPLKATTPTPYLFNKASSYSSSKVTGGHRTEYSTLISDPYHLRLVKPVSRTMFKEILDSAIYSSYSDSIAVPLCEEGDRSARSSLQNEYSDAQKKRDLLRREGVFTICPMASNNKLARRPRCEGGDEKSNVMYQEAAKVSSVRQREDVSETLCTDGEHNRRDRRTQTTHCDIFISNGLYDSVARRVGFQHLLPSPSPSPLPPLPPLHHTMLADTKGIADRNEKHTQPSSKTKSEQQLLGYGLDYAYTSITAVDVEKAMREHTEACASAILSVGAPSAHMKSLVALRHKLLSTAFLELNVEPNNSEEWGQEEEEASPSFTSSMDKANKRKEETSTISNCDHDVCFVRSSPADHRQHIESVSKRTFSRAMFGQRVLPYRLVPPSFCTHGETFNQRLCALANTKESMWVDLEGFFALSPPWYQQWLDRRDGKKHSSDLLLKNRTKQESEVTVYKSDRAAAMRDALATHVIKNSGRIYYVVPPPPPPTAVPLPAYEQTISSFSSKPHAYSQWFSHIKSKGLAAKEATLLLDFPFSYSSSPHKYAYCGDAAPLSPKILWNVFPIFPSPATRELHNANSKTSLLGDHHHHRNEIDALLAPYHKNNDNKNKKFLREGKDVELSSFAGRVMSLPNEPVAMSFDRSRAAALRVHNPHTSCGTRTPSSSQKIHHTNRSSHPPPVKTCLESNECPRSSLTRNIGSSESVSTPDLCTSPCCSCPLGTFPSANPIAPIMIAPDPSRAYGLHDLRSKETVSATFPTLPLIFDETSSPVPDQHGVLFVANHKKARYFEQNVLSAVKTPPPLIHGNGTPASVVVGMGIPSIIHDNKSNETPTLCGVISDLHMSLLRRRIATMPPPQMLDRSAAHIPGGTIPHFTHTTPEEDAEEERIVRELGISTKCLGFTREQTSFFAPVDTN